jgi:hypothetical protein
MAAVVLTAFSLVLVNYRPQLPITASSAQNMSAQPIPLEGDDQQLMGRVSLQAPDVRRTYEDNLREVNAYIADARQAVERDPADVVAREQLQDAYQQKQMLYEMATLSTLP